MEFCVGEIEKLTAARDRLVELEGKLLEAGLHRWSFVNSDIPKSLQGAHEDPGVNRKSSLRTCLKDTTASLSSITLTSQGSIMMENCLQDK